MGIAVLKDSEIKKVEKKTARQFGISESQMITQAGFAVFLQAQKISRSWAQDSPKKWVILCGKGHNGADGLQCALFAKEAGIQFDVYHMRSEKPYSRETQRLLNQLAGSQVQVHLFKRAAEVQISGDTGLVIDGLLGAGLTEPARGPVRGVINKINQSRLPVLSIDVPSGVSSEGLFAEPCVQASHTLCLGGAKIVCAFLPFRNFFGITTFSPLCFPPDILKSQKSACYLLWPSDVRQIYPFPPASAHKYQMGKILVIAGSQGMPGAPLLAAEAAARAGAGLVKLAVPGSIYPSVAKRLLEVIGIPIGSAQDPCFRSDHIRGLMPHLKWAEAVLIGPGLGTAVATREFLQDVRRHINCPLILDGDALQANFLKKGLSPKTAGPLLITPHAGEYARLGGTHQFENPWAHVSLAQEFSRRKNLHLVLKGPTTLHSDPEGNCRLLPWGPPGLATAGAGDVLAGILAAFLSRHAPQKAVDLGVCLHTAAAHMAAVKKSQRGMIAGDIIKYIPETLLKWENGETN